MYENILSQKKEIARLSATAQFQKKEKLNEEDKKAEAQQTADLQKFESTETQFLPTDSKSSDSSSKGKLPSFWIPSLTPQAKATTIDTSKLETVCTAVEKSHPIHIKKLIAIKFTTAKSAPGASTEPDSKSEYACPACLKSFKNGTKMTFPKGCGHVVCGQCANMFIKKTGKCYVCDVKCRDKDLIELFVEGTGFASGGQAEAKKTFVAFQ
ncbi:hypothetical protein SmJEL517_g03284 [Synchytrium microbalum]|uniref:RING-type domain-containing protein n=1 Tax=Synchytrium microbalum TaxID=1806994 RepID=A0A507C3I2_9FUNG|nr:uncharacterized protein SmJEL517_g03284 [Synchytrium microbalum]TPX34021.1 hypothetical protein SmJEL517_g03284 [Synchytrium microbalum]